MAGKKMIKRKIFLKNKMVKVVSHLILSQKAKVRTMSKSFLKQIMRFLSIAVKKL